MIFSGEILYNRAMSAIEDLEKIEATIRLGQMPDAQKALKKLSARNSTIFEKTKAASLARRAALPQLSVKWFFPFVYPDGRLDRECSTSVLLEYGASLVFAGALIEGRRILDLVTQRNEPHAFLYLAFSYVREWDYESSGALLKRFLKEAECDSYTRFVAQVNLLASHVKTQPHEAETSELCAEILKNAQGNDYRRLLLNAMELKVQLCVAREDYDNAEKTLHQISMRAPHEKSSEYLFWMKWKLILQYHTEKNAHALAELIRLAETFSHGETLRDAHLRWALHKKDCLLFEHVYVGTPHVSFRAEAAKKFKDKFAFDFVPSEKQYFLADRPGFKPLSDIPHATCALDLSTGFLCEALAQEWRPEYKIHGLPFKLLQFVCEDFYQSMNIVELSAKLYPHSYFHPLHSIQGVFQVLKRINSSFQERGLESRVELSNLKYQLRSTDLALVKSQVESAPLREEEWSLLKTFSKDPEQFFTRKELERITQSAPRSLSRYLEKLVKAEELLVVGRGPNTRYFKNQKQRA